jgi:protein TonB
MKIRKNPKADLENKRKLFLEIGFIVTLVLVLVAFEYRSYEPVTLKNDPFIGNIDVETLPPVTVFKKPAPPPPPSVVIINPTTDDVDDVEIEIIDVFIGQDEPVVWEPPVYTKEEEVLPDDTPVLVASENAEFPGGITALSQFLKDNIVYPKMAKDLNIQGTVYVSFIIEKDGSVSGVKSLRPLGYGLDEEAIRVVSSMPYWTPAKQNGRRVRLIMNIPVKFTLVSY